MTADPLMEKAKLILKWCDDVFDDGEFLEKVADLLRQVRAEALADMKNNEKWHKAGYEDGVNDAARVAEKRIRTKVCNDSGHDDRWCGACENKWDEADEIANSIRALKEPTNG